MHQNHLQKLKKWFLDNQRDLPWRDNPSPYAVWVSEVMLQQTQVSVVIPYFQRWMQRFPSIPHLAKSPIDDVLKEWEGLGYYSRARNLHAGAKYCVDHFNSSLPDTADQLAKIKGLGPYTIGAILSFAFHQRMPAVDGNVMRVLARYYAISDDIGKTKTQKYIQALALSTLPEKEPWIIAEALIELGATICMRNPKCTECPLKGSCQAYQNGSTASLPIKACRTQTIQLYRAVAVIACDDKILVRKGIEGQIMADLYEFPYIELTSLSETKEAIAKYLSKELKLKTQWHASLSPTKHSFTKYQAMLQPHFYTVEKPHQINGYSWQTIAELKKVPFSAGHRKIFAELQTNKYSVK